MFLNFFLSIKIPGVFAHRQPELSFVHFQALTHAVADVARLLIFAALDQIVLVPPFVDVGLILPASFQNQTAAFAVVDLLLS